MFGKLFGGAKKMVDQVTNRDLLEAIGALSLYVASGDGIDAKEYDQLRVSIAGNAALSAFSESDISSVLGKFRQQLETSPRMAKLAIRKEVEDITDPAQALVVAAVACDVADQDGINESEKARLIEGLGWLRVNAKDFGL